MKIIKACLKFYNEKDHDTNSNANSQTGDIDNSVIPVSGQTSECSFEIVLKHTWLVLSFQVKVLTSLFKND